MTLQVPRGTVLRCPVCGAEIAVLSRRHGEFTPRCCNRNMVPLARRLVFFICPVCGSEVALLQGPGTHLQPRCCHTDMRREAA